MCDFLGKELKLGDSVVYLSHSRTSSRYIKTKVCGFTHQKVYLEWGSCVYPDKLIRYEE